MKKHNKKSSIKKHAFLLALIFGFGSATANDIDWGNICTDMSFSHPILPEYCDWANGDGA